MLKNGTNPHITNGVSSVRNGCEKVTNGNAKANGTTAVSSDGASKSCTDQYADGRAAKLWQAYIGDTSSRTQYYRSFIIGLLRQNGCKNILDVACGTGIDSVMLVEEGFHVMSVDASDKMLKYALRTRWNRRKEANFDNWVIEEGNWLTLPEDLDEMDAEGILPVNYTGNSKYPQQFDALICLGNSFAHLPDSSEDQKDHRRAIKNFSRLVRPGGIFIIDHRNYDYILDTGRAPSRNIYYNSTCVQDIHTSVLYKNGKPNSITLDYVMDVSRLGKAFEDLDDGTSNHFRLSYYPHRLESFTRMLKEAFGSRSQHEVFGDFKPLGVIEDPAFYVHIVKKSEHDN